MVQNESNAPPSRELLFLSRMLLFPSRGLQPARPPALCDALTCSTAQAKACGSESVARKPWGRPTRTMTR